MALNIYIGELMKAQSNIVKTNIENINIFIQKYVKLVNHVCKLHLQSLLSKLTIYTNNILFYE